MDEAERLAALYELDLLDTAPEKEYDDLVRLASVLCGVPISRFTLVDRDRQWIKASVGERNGETQRGLSFCSHVIQQAGMTTVEDAREDERFRENAMVLGTPRIRFYAGMPVHAPGGAPIGTLCLIDTVPHTLTSDQQEGLAILARQVELCLQLRASGKIVKRTMAENEREHLLHSFLDLIPNVSFIKDEAGRYLFYNKAFAAFCGIDQDAWLGKTDFDVFPWETANAMHRHDLQVIQSVQPVETLEEVVSAAGGVHAFRTLKFTYRSFDGQTILGAVSVDITDQIRREQELAHANMQLELLAATDPLTGLPNRRVFEHRAAVEFAIARRAQRPLSIMVMDIDNFKQRNDLLGHAAGDEALRALSVAIAECTRVTDLAARIGGEEFAYLLPDTPSSGAIILANRIQTALREIQAGPIALTVSIGVATIDSTTPTWEQLLSRADDAMYEAKRTGKNRFVVHDAPLAQLLNAPRTSPRKEN